MPMTVQHLLVSRQILLYIYIVLMEPGSGTPKETLVLWDQLHGCDKTLERAPAELLVVGGEGEGVLTLM